MLEVIRESLGVHLELVGSSFFGSFRVHWGHWKLLEDCLGFIRIALRVIGGYWGIIGVRWEFIFGSFEVR